MFGFSGSLLAGQHDSHKERTPPAKPTPVTFPSLAPPEASTTEPPSGWTESSSTIPAYFLSLKKPSDIKEETLRLLNVSFEPQVDLESLLSSEYLPSKSWLETPGKDDSEAPPASVPPVQLLSNGRRVPDRNEFYTRVKELFHENQDAFMAFSRKATPGYSPLRLAHFRKFWEGLDNLAYYWDDSLDEYLPPKPDTSTTQKEEVSKSSSQPDEPNGTLDPPLESPEPGPSPEKKPKTHETTNTTTTIPINSRAFPDPSPAPTPVSTPTPLPTPLPPRTSISSSKELPARTLPPPVPGRPSKSKQEDLSKGSYRGNRTGTGVEMPDQYRLECVRSFIEPIAWAFGVTLVSHRRPPVLAIQHIRFPVRMNSAGWRGPQDRMRARQGWLEGPLLGIQCRPDTNFGASGNLEAESVLDAVRELGGMLLLAQERAREGKAELRAGEGKWWTSAPRWGGGPGGEVGEAMGGSDGAAKAEEKEKDKDGKKEEEKPKGPTRPRVGSTRDRRRPTPAEVWKTLRPGNPLWDPKVIYEAIGKEKGSEWDEIFMVSSLNHHISILKLRLHRCYIQYLTDGTLPMEPPSDPKWCSPSLSRTKWYDLFNIEDRKEAMRGIWGVLAYLMRSQKPAEDAEDVAMKEA